jgi:hypothetical protein
MAVNSYRLLSGYVLRVRDPITGELVLTIAEASFIIKNATYTVQTLLGKSHYLGHMIVIYHHYHAGDGFLASSCIHMRHVDSYLV